MTIVDPLKAVYLTRLHFRRTIRVWSSRLGLSGRQLAPYWAAWAARVCGPHGLVGGFRGRVGRR